jgi:anti-sigma B factor antagonist
VAGTVTGRSPGDPLLSVATVRPGPGVIRLQVAGEVDLATAPRLQAAQLAAVAAAAAPAEVQVDLYEVTFLDAVGIGVLVRGREAARRTGLGFSAYNAHGIVLRVLEVVGLADVFLVRRGHDLTT